MGKTIRENGWPSIDLVDYCPLSVNKHYADMDIFSNSQKYAVHSVSHRNHGCTPYSCNSRTVVIWHCVNLPIQTQQPLNITSSIHP